MPLGPGPEEKGLGGAREEGGQRRLFPVWFMQLLEAGLLCCIVLLWSLPA